MCDRYRIVFSGMNFIIATIIIALAAWFFISGLKRKKTIPDAFPATYRNTLEEYVHYYKVLSPEDKTRFEASMLHFLSTIAIEGVKTEVTDEDRVFIAASAVIPIFAFPEWKYKNLTAVLLYPDTFDETYQFEGNRRSILGMVGSGDLNGKMLLSQQALREGFINSGDRSNTGIHEFVHLLDKSDGMTDGVPETLLKHQYVMPWVKLMHEEIRKIMEQHSDINPYGATNEAEFFAVVSEYFFERPDLLQERHPALYDILTQAFHQQMNKAEA